MFLSYKRARFTAQLETGRLYTPSHFWLQQQSAPVWRVGLTKFGSRMLGEMVDFGFQVKPGDPVKPGETIGWLEGFKALSDLFCVGQGKFGRSNPAMDADPAILNQDPHGTGWLYEFSGEPDATAMDVQAYARHLDNLIDKLSQKD